MAIYAIGDIQGCFDSLLKLVDHIAFNPVTDKLWFVGDLVNRGPKSLQTLRYVKSLGSSAITVLGNHDLHLLAAAYGNDKHFKADSDLINILKADDRDELVDWLRWRPVLHHDAELNVTLIHAGLPPQWDLDTAKACAIELETALRGKNHRDYFKHMYGNQPDLWRANFKGIERLRFITNCLTRMRFCDANGRLDHKAKGKAESPPKGLFPWYAAPNRKTVGDRIVFGHWSTLGYYEGNNVYAIDSGCLWGGRLTALRLDTAPFTPIHIDCPGARKPGE
ncbi:MAG: symmetrical bis(5'-nucleosyl)-tetraphosphatase [Gammaproteobacteria bacterium]|nr:symmetrical bis(5'-nucleosyl)-tetraphosphatase [Gammaproteobacteria bacterium]MCP5137771.1 symmetrical bis(5'-nucleosyl)-tetraphosphatase [Gammaproteobacteria bacterium]